MPVSRSKAASRNGLIDIHATVADWYQAVDIPYIAHAFLANGTIVCIRPTLRTPAGNAAAGHPDQLYWRAFNGGNHAVAVAAVTNSIAAAGVANITRIDIDCKLMPCTGVNGCFVAVPALMRNLYGLANVPLRIFSHANENMGGNGSSKRVITTTSAAGAVALTNAYNAHDGWGWTV